MTNIFKRLSRIPTSAFFFLSFALHVTFLLFGQWMDRKAEFGVAYTDVDYHVFTEGADHMLNGHSPYNRHTFRYPPVIALLAIPNIVVHPICAKVILSVLNILIGFVLQDIIVFRKSGNVSQEGKNGRNSLLLCFWLLNPFVIQVTTRGNADSVPAFFVLLFIRNILRKRIFYAAVAFGIAVHVKIYPLIHALPAVLYLSGGLFTSPQKLFKSFSRDRLYNIVLFTLVSFGTFSALLAFCYYLYGWDFIFQSYLYHLGRHDHRHNLSPFFYLMYLTFDLAPPFSTAAKFALTVLKIVTIGQWGTTLAIGLKYAVDHFPLAMFLQTAVFVPFNKVCTVQYFIWWMALLPLALDSVIKYPIQNKLQPASTPKNVQKKTDLSRYNFKIVFPLLLCFALWSLSMGAWMHQGYLLEFCGLHTFVAISLAGWLFFFASLGIPFSFIIQVS